MFHDTHDKTVSKQRNYTCPSACVTSWIVRVRVVAKYWRRSRVNEQRGHDKTGEESSRPIKSSAKSVSAHDKACLGACLICLYPNNTTAVPAPCPPIQRNRFYRQHVPFSSATDSATASRGGGSMALFKNASMSPSLRSLIVRASSWRGVRRISGVACSASL